MASMRVLVCGGRYYDNHEFLACCLDKIDKKYGIDLIIEGGAHGADQLAATWANQKIKPRMTFHANWHGLGNSAGPIRNKQMITYGLPDVVVAFEGGKGTESMCKLAEANGIRVWRTWL